MRAPSGARGLSEVAGVVLPGREGAEASLLTSGTEIRRVPQPPRGACGGSPNRYSRLRGHAMKGFRQGPASQRPHWLLRGEQIPRGWRRRGGLGEAPTVTQVKRGDKGCVLRVEPVGSETERGAKGDLSQGVDSHGVHQGGHDGRGHVWGVVSMKTRTI